MAEEQQISRAESSGTSLQATPFPLDYFLVTFAFSWLFWGLAWFFSRGSEVATGATEDLLAGASPIMLVMILIGVFGPFFSAFMLTWRSQGKAGALELWKSGWRFKIGYKWLLIGLLLFPALWFISLNLGGAGVSFEAFTNPLKLLGLTVFMWFLGGPFGEEFGWRGYALPRLLKNYSAMNASVILGIFWVCWHLPLFIIPGSPQAQIPFWPWAVGVIALAIIMTWVHVHVGGVVFAALLVHTTSNLAHELAQPVLEVPIDWSGPDAYNLYLQVALAVLLVLVFGHKHLKRE